MNIKQLAENFTISEQITLEDIETLATLGIKTLICNRPDGEEPNQITCAEINTVAAANGIDFVHIPVAGKDVPAESLEKFATVLQETNDRVHAYCRSGTRAAIFWDLSQQEKSQQS